MLWLIMVMTAMIVVLDHGDGSDDCCGYSGDLQSQQKTCDTDAMNNTPGRSMDT